MSLVTVIPEEIRSPILTADWEKKLLKAEKQKLSPKTFMTDIEKMISSFVDTYEAVQEAEAMRQKPALKIGIYPVCGRNIEERQKGYFCSNKDCHFALWKENRYFDTIEKKLTKEIAKILLRKAAKEAPMIIGQVAVMRLPSALFEAVVRIESVEYHPAEEAPFPLDKIKHVIRRFDGEKDADLL